MIIVNTLAEFQTFIDLAKQQNLPYSIIGAEKEDFEGALTPSIQLQTSFTFLLQYGQKFTLSGISAPQCLHFIFLTTSFLYISLVFIANSFVLCYTHLKGVLRMKSSELNVKNQEKVLKILSKLCRESSMPWIYRPVDFEKKFPFVSVEALIDILDILADKGYISVQYADLPNSFNINTLQVTPKGLDYQPQKTLKVKERWLERLWGFLFGTMLGSVATYFITAILNHIFGK